MPVVLDISHGFIAGVDEEDPHGCEFIALQTLAGVPKLLVTEADALQDGQRRDTNKLVLRGRQLHVLSKILIWLRKRTVSEVPVHGVSVEELVGQHGVSLSDS